MGNQASSPWAVDRSAKRKSSLGVNADRKFSLMAASGSGTGTPQVGTADAMSNEASAEAIYAWITRGGSDAPPPAAEVSATVNLSHKKLGDAEVSILASALHLWPDLRELALGFNGFGDAGVMALVESCERKGLQKLERLYLAGNNIGENGVGALSSALKSKALPACLVYINLAKNPDAEEHAWLVEELLKGKDGYL